MKAAARNGSTSPANPDPAAPSRRRDALLTASSSAMVTVPQDGRTQRSPVRGRTRVASPPVPTSRVQQQRPATVSYSRGDQIFTPDTGEGMVYIIRSGCIRLYKTLSDGRSINVGLLGPNTIFAQEDSSDGFATGTTAEALVPSTLSIVESEDLANLISDSPELASAVVAGMTRRLTELQTLVEHLLVRDTSVRLSVMLLNLASKFGRPSHGGLEEITLPLTHQGLANMIGSNRVTVTRKLLELQRDGSVRSLGRNILAVDVGRLQAYATGSSPAERSTDDQTGRGPTAP